MSVYDEVTQAIIAELEQGVLPWVKSWQSHLPQRRRGRAKPAEGVAEQTETTLKHSEGQFRRELPGLKV